MVAELRTRWQALIARLDSLSPRERLLVFGAAALGLSALFIFGLITPLQERAQQLTAETYRLNEELRQLRLQSSHTDTPARPRNDAKADLQAMLQRAADARAVAESVRQLMSIQPEARLLSLRLLPARPLLEQQQQTLTPETLALRSGVGRVATHDSAQPPAAPSVRPRWYAHGIQIELEGSYAGLTAAIESIERLPWLLEWRSLRLDGSEHPRIRLSLELAAIGRETAWVNR
ncbi:MAG: type II secretion system protein GspM [Burkholderiales bacterium]|nr:type II secretion system protein GspM [Burkholderiales bacterium]